MEFKCYYSECSKSYNSKYNLKRHINTNHLCLKSYPCDICGRVFASKKNVTNHKASHNDFQLDGAFVLKGRKRKNKIKEVVDIPPLILTLHYVEESTKVVFNLNLNKQTLPSLAPVDVCRQNHQSNGKNPLLPILLNYISPS